MPLPLFALYFLRKQKINGPHDILEAAIRLRKNDEIKKVRNWLNKKEKSKKPIKELRSISRLMREELNDSYSFKAILSDVAIIPLELPTLPRAVLKPLRRCFDKYVRGRIFLPIVSDLAEDDDLADMVFHILGRSMDLTKD